MKQNIKNYRFKIISFLYLFLITGFFGFSLLANANDAYGTRYDCGANVSFGINKSQIANYDEVFTLNLTVVATNRVPYGTSFGNGGDCTAPSTPSQVSSTYYVSIYDKNSSKEVGFYQLNLPAYTGPKVRSTDNPPTYTWTKTDNIILSQKGISSGNTFNFVAQVKIQPYYNGSYSKLTESSPVSVIVGTGGNFKVTILPTVNNGSDLTIIYTNAPTGAKGDIFVNDPTHFVKFSPTGNIITVNQQNGFTSSGINNITLAIEDVSGNDLYKNIVPVTVTQSSSGSQANDSNCSDSSQCKSNFCSADTSKCAACTGNSDCNSAGDTGFACNLGVCIKSTALTGTVKTYACPSLNANPVWVCSTDNQPGCGDVSGCTSATCQSVNVSQCGQAATPTSGGPAAGNPGNTVADTKLTTTLYNPLPESDLTHAFLVIAQGLLAILGVFAVVFIIVGGFQMLTSAGNEETLLKAKKTIIWAILGLVVALMSFSIIIIVQDLLQANIQPPPSTTTTPAPQGAVPNPPSQGAVH
jgi:hypothetical protein